MTAKEQKIQEIVAHFVGSDQALGQRITAAIAHARSQPNPGPDHIIAQFTSDPALTATIKAWIAKVRAGHNVQNLVGYHIGDAQTVQTTTVTALSEKGAVEHILST